MKKITKAVIPCGGMGTRFLPITKAVPKEILPIIDTPVLAYIVGEAIESGISDIMIVLGQGKDSIRNYFTPNPKLEDALLSAGKKEELELVKRITNRANIVFATQAEPKGSGDAVMYAKSFTGGDAFCLAWGDDLIYSPKNPVMGQLITAHAKTGGAVLGVQHWAGDDITKYGVADVTPAAVIASEAKQSGIYKCRGIIEKPPLEKVPPSRLAALGRYVLTADIYETIQKTPVSGRELGLTDALNIMAKNGGVYAYDFEGTRYDMGDKLGSLKATVEFGLRNTEYGKEFAEYIKRLT